MPEITEPTKSPDSTSPREDVGADTQRRFRHQAAYIALISLGLLESDSPLGELYCEHHDDVILRLKSGQFRAIQLKTREIGGVPFKAGDDQVVSTIRGFALLEAAFPGHFDTYTIASNIGFWHGLKNRSNLDHILRGVSTAGSGYMPLVNKILEDQKTLDVAIVVSALQKVKLIVTPGLDDVKSRLREQLAQISEFRGRRYDELKTSSEALRNLIFDASSLSGANLIPEYLALCSGSPLAVRNQHVIQSKRITSSIVSETLKRGLSSPTLLRTRQLVPIEELPIGMKTMEIKMAAGGLSVSEIDHLKDLKFSAEHLLQEWLYRYGNQSQLYYEHLRVVVRDECLAAQQASRQAQGLYGNNMLADLRERLQRRAATRAAEIPECYKEHLLGMAGILTEDCTVWWSAEFNLPDETA